MQCVPDDAPVLENRISESEKRGSDAVAAMNEHESFIANWIEHEIPWSELCSKRQLSLKPN